MIRVLIAEDQALVLDNRIEAYRMAREAGWL
jgi:hypothetical protein